MISVFLDTNVLVDYLAERQEFFSDALMIVSLAIDKKLKLNIAAMSFATASYLMSKHYHNDSSAVKEAISKFIKYCNVTVVDRKTVNDAISADFNDFEDAMQYSCATHCGADYIITRNLKDYAASDIPCYEPGEFIKAMTED